MTVGFLLLKLEEDFCSCSRRSPYFATYILENYRRGSAVPMRPVCCIYFHTIAAYMLEKQILANFMITGKEIFNAKRKVWGVQPLMR